MILSGKIAQIDTITFQTCKVNIPAFINPGSTTFLIDARFSNQPGIYGNYKVNDTVFVAFEENDLSHAMVIGKLLIDKKEEDQVDGSIKTKTITTENLIVSGNVIFSNPALAALSALTQPKNENAEKENYENLIDKFKKIKIDTKSQADVSVYPEAQIGTFGIIALNNKEPKLMRQEFVVDSPGALLSIGFTENMKQATVVKINVNDTFIISDDTVLTPGIYESGAQIFEVKPDLKNKIISIKITGIQNVTKLYLTTEYWK